MICGAKRGIITQLNKAILERILNDEGRVAGNSRNGYGKETLKSNFGQLELSTPRDRHSTFKPQIIPKCSTKAAILEEAIFSLYAKGMTVRDIQATLQDLYRVEVSPSLISKVTDVVNEKVEQWGLSTKLCKADKKVVQNLGQIVSINRKPYSLLRSPIYQHYREMFLQCSILFCSQRSNHQRDKTRSSRAYEMILPTLRTCLHNFNERDKH